MQYTFTMYDWMHGSLKKGGGGVEGMGRLLASSLYMTFYVSKPTRFMAFQVLSFTWNLYTLRL